jgi:hypothetical protein
MNIDQFNQILLDPFDHNTETIGMIVASSPKLPFELLNVISRQFSSEYFIIDRQVQINGMNFYLFICVRTISPTSPALDPIDRVVVVCPFIIDEMINLNMQIIKIYLFHRWHLCLEIDQHKQIITNCLVNYAAV